MAWSEPALRHGRPPTPTTPTPSSLTPTDTATNKNGATEIQIVVVPAANALSLTTAQSFTFEGTSAAATTGDAIGIADELVTSSGTTPTAPTWSLGDTTKYAYVSTAFS